MKERKESAVSPVVGVMLMLVVTIIIAGVVAAFAGGLGSTEKTAPTIVASTEIWSAESYDNYAYGRFAMTVESVSEPVSTADLKLVTSWTGDDGVKYGNTTTAGMKNTKYDSYEYNAPIGMGSGVTGNQMTSGGYGENQWFGNYTLSAGTSMTANGAYTGEGKKGGIKTHTANDAMDAILGDTWSENLEKGDIVSVKLIYLPSNAVIYEKEVIVK
ncbi:MAG TPA: type IV pilin N-terminal domain-containing protein [Methanocorpusculum sp.]|nr:type IV pilin N-terminal domain-containing protein [Methanocorpusculum sp.]